MAVFCLCASCFAAAQTAVAAPGFAGLDPNTMDHLNQAHRQLSPDHLTGTESDAGDASNRKPPPDARGDDRPPANAASEPDMSSSEAAQIARQRAGGRVLNVILEHGPNGPYYLVKILEQGRVRVVHIDARP